MGITFAQAAPKPGERLATPAANTPQKPALTQDQLVAGMNSLKGFMAPLEKAGQQKSPAYQNWNKQYEDYANQLRLLQTPAK